MSKIQVFEKYGGSMMVLDNYLIDKTNRIGKPFFLQTFSNTSKDVFSMIQPSNNDYLDNKLDIFDNFNNDVSIKRDVLLGVYHGYIHNIEKHKISVNNMELECSESQITRWGIHSEDEVIVTYMSNGYKNKILFLFHKTREGNNFKYEIKKTDYQLTYFFDENEDKYKHVFFLSAKDLPNEKSNFIPLLSRGTDMSKSLNSLVESINSLWNFSLNSHNYNHEKLSVSSQKNISMLATIKEKLFYNV